MLINRRRPLKLLRQSRKCSIMAYLCVDNMYTQKTNMIDTVWDSFRTIQHRGPDASKLVRCSVSRDALLFMGFHQLHITSPDSTSSATQPMLERSGSSSHIMHCNGELYSHPELDCGVLRQMNPDCVLDNVDGEFAYGSVQYDHQSLHTEINVFTDHLGIRPVFVAVDKKGVGWASEAKALLQLFHGSDIRRLSPHQQFHAQGKNLTEILENAHIKDKQPKHRTSTMIHSGYQSSQHSEQDHCAVINDIMQRSVTKMVSHGNRPVGCLLSGGLDSSVVATIAASVHGPGLPTFSIGLPGSTDAPNARRIADAIQSNHTHIEITEENLFNTVEDVIKCLESYDTTTIRASTPQYLLAKYISEHTDIKVLLGGDGSDELGAGYLYSHRAPSAYALKVDASRLLNNIHVYDALRGDRTMAAHGLEMRFPFLDREFVDYCLNLPPSLLTPSISKFAPHQRVIEKRLFRDAFLHTGILRDVCYRQKEAFSDGISSNIKGSKPWYKKRVDETLESEQDRYNSIFDKHFPYCRHLIPGYWLPQWSSEKDPSARKLDNYN